MSMYESVMNAEDLNLSLDVAAELRRSLFKLIQLYTDKSHFIFELLQNAEDAEARNIKFVQYKDRLEVLHDGIPFTQQNLEALRSVGRSDKAANLNKIGEFGVGFKSVFCICDKVKIYSEPQNFRQTPEQSPIPFALELRDFNTYGNIDCVEMEPWATTKFVFPYAVGKPYHGFDDVNALNNSISQRLQSLGISVLLFLTELTKIEYEICLEDKKTGKYQLQEEDIEPRDHIRVIDRELPQYNHRSSRVFTDGNDIICGETYLKFSREVNIQNVQKRIDIAFPVLKCEDGSYTFRKITDSYISVYFPTSTLSKLGFLVQGPYRTNPNREGVPFDDSDNKKLASYTAELLCEAIGELRDRKLLNISIFDVLPISAEIMDEKAFFRPVYEKLIQYLKSENNAVLPTYNGNSYVSCKNARIARGKELLELFNYKQLTRLLQCKSVKDKLDELTCNQWLPVLSDNSELYKFFNLTLGVDIIRPDDLRKYFEQNSSFLIERKGNRDWLIKLYGVLGKLGSLFLPATTNNMLSVPFIKTAKGELVAPRSKVANQYFPNVYLPSEYANISGVHVVDPDIYVHCRDFFDNVLLLKSVDEKELGKKRIMQRYKSSKEITSNQHITDLLFLSKYGLLTDAEIQSVFKLFCKGGEQKTLIAVKGKRQIYFSIFEDIEIESYLQNIHDDNTVAFVDAEFYREKGIEDVVLLKLGVKGSILCNAECTSGQLETPGRGKNPTWEAMGNFRWKLTIEYLEKALDYIENNPDDEQSQIKSRTILRILCQNEKYLCGELKTTGRSVPEQYKGVQFCEMIQILQRKKIKWLYSEDDEWVAPSNVSKYSLKKSVYGTVSTSSKVYNILGFRQTEDDLVFSVQQNNTQAQLDAYLEAELKRRFNISLTDLSQRRLNLVAKSDQTTSADFPSYNVKSWESLNRHAEEMIVYAEPIRYEKLVRKVRVNYDACLQRHYLEYMYELSNQRDVFACQLCKKRVKAFDAVQLSNDDNLLKQLPPFHLCLCSECAKDFRAIRGDQTKIKEMFTYIEKLQKEDISAADIVKIPLDNHELWFTQTHIAEVNAILQLIKV